MTQDTVTWEILFSDHSTALTDGMFKFSTSSGDSVNENGIMDIDPGGQDKLLVECYPKQGSFSATFQLKVNGDKSLASYFQITLNVNVPSGLISCEPAELAMIPAPLNSPVSAVFVLTVQGFVR